MTTNINDYLAQFYAPPGTVFSGGDEMRRNYEAGFLFLEVNNGFRTLEKSGNGWQWFLGLCRRSAGAYPLDTGVNVHPDDVKAVCECLHLVTVEDLISYCTENSAIDSVGLLKIVTNSCPDVGPMQTVHIADFWPRILAEFDCEEGVTCNLQDWDYRMPTVDQVKIITRACPSKEGHWVAESNDCDDFSRVARGWLSANGLGNCTIFTAEINIYTDDNVVVGAHSLLICVTDQWVKFLEPQTMQFVPSRTYTLGLLGATKCKLRYAVQA